MREALRLQRVSAGYGETHVLEGIDLALAEGESLSVIGRNGVGKSTLLETIMGHTTLHAGEIAFGGRRIDAVAGVPARPGGPRLRAAGARDLPVAHGAGEPRDLRAPRATGTPTRVFELFPNLQTPARQRGHAALRRRAADARHRARADDQPVAAADGRADRRARAGDRAGADPRARAAARRGRPVDRAGRAEQPRGAGFLRAHGGHGQRPDRLRRAGPSACAGIPTTSPA